jgi:hypothetical protein
MRRGKLRHGRTARDATHPAGIAEQTQLFQWIVVHDLASTLSSFLILAQRRPQRSARPCPRATPRFLSEATATGKAPQCCLAHLTHMEVKRLRPRVFHSREFRKNRDGRFDYFLDLGERRRAVFRG